MGFATARVRGMEQREERRAGESSRGEAGLGNRVGEEQGQIEQEQEQGAGRRRGAS